MDNSPVFIVGSARSGTSLMYSLLLASGEFAIYEAETHLLRTCPAKYGPLTVDANWQRFLNDWVASKQFQRSKLDVRQFMIGAEDHRDSYFELLDFFMKEICRVQGKVRWAENTPNHTHIIPEIASFFPDAKFIHIIRDGRAVASSLIKLGWTSSKFSIKSKLITAGLAWEKNVLCGRRAGQELAGRYIEIRFEDLILAPEDTLKKIEIFLSIKLDIVRLKNTRVGVIGKQNTAFEEKNRKRELFFKESIYRWQKTLPEKDKNVINASVFDTLKQFGYLEYTSKSNKTFFLTLLVYYYKSMMSCKELIKFRLGLGRFLASGLEELP